MTASLALLLLGLWAAGITGFSIPPGPYGPGLIDRGCGIRGLPAPGPGDNERGISLNLF